MREYRGPDGDRRLWYEAHEIDAIAVDELTRADLLPGDEDDLSIDIEEFVRTHLKLPFDQHASLRDDVLGVTEFLVGKKPKIAINRDLTGSALDDEDPTPGLVGRWRATVAHEASHVLLHRLLFERDDVQPSLFSNGDGLTHVRLLRCLKRDVGYERQASDWREVQANMGMAALLMPRPIFVNAARAALARFGQSVHSVREGSPIHTRLIAELSQRFKVSKQAAGIRLGGFGIVEPTRQPSL